MSGLTLFNCWICLFHTCSSPFPALSTRCPPAHSLSRWKEKPVFSLSRLKAHRGTWEMRVWSNERRAGRGCKELSYLKGASATALVVMVMWSEKSFQFDKKRTETPVWSWRCTTAWWDIQTEWCESPWNNNSLKHPQEAYIFYYFNTETFPLFWKYILSNVAYYCISMSFFSFF